ncbi:unnamed protein product [Coregonus sp. 'balchen']|nr:unnamed protein product [Coregonus sp. 'balchen']
MFMLRKDTVGVGETAAEFKERFHARLNVTAKSVPLMIQRVQMSDSAVYYCALKPTVTTGYTAPLQKHCMCARGSHGNDITPATDKVFGLEGDVIKLSCNYSSASNLQWYRQDPESSPIFLLLTGVTSNPSVVNVTDSALYYCALQPIVTGNPETLYKNLTAHDKLLFQQTIQPNQHEVYGEEGSNVQLSCNYSSSYSVLWYKQYPGSAPQFLLFIHHAYRTVVRAKPPYPHLTVKLNKEKTCVDLEISSGEVTDSALYYCAVKPTLVYLVCVRMSLILLFLLSVFVADSMEQETITPLKSEVNVLQGTDITLSCNYKGNVNNCQWYRQYPGSRPECLLLILPTNKYVQNTSITTPRHTGRLNEEKTRVDLKISSAILEDSALYYCALQPTVTGNPDTPHKNLSRSLWINSSSYEEEIISATTEEHVFEGDGVILSCNYTGSYSTDTLLLYQQYPRSKPEFLILITEGGFKTHLTTNNCKGEEAVDQQSGHVTALEGGLVTLSCKYTTSTTSPDLFWYIQLTRDSPQYVLRRDRYSEGSNSDAFKKRFVSRLNFTSSSVPLMIQRLQLSDSAVYYCALRPTVTTGDSVTVQKLRLECCSDNVTSFSMFDDTQKEEETRKCRGEDSVTQSPGDVIATEGEQVKLDCQFDTLDTDPFLFWYKQGANDFPKYMLRRTTFGSDNAIEFQGRFNAHLNLTTFLSASKSVPLTIQRLQLSDSAVYYCALRPTVTTGYTSPLQKLDVIHGGSVKLSCNYTVSGGGSVLWYHQYPTSAPQFLLLISVYSASVETIVTAEPPYPRLSVNVDKVAERVYLEISSAEVTNSALYYCALRPTVTGNPDTLYNNCTEAVDNNPGCELFQI